MTKMAALLKPTGTMILSIPVGLAGVYAPWHRVYGEEREQRLLEPFHVAAESYWAKLDSEKYEPVERATAFAQQGSATYYALALYKLEPRWTQPRLTVVTPSLNQARYLERCIRSVLDQGYPNLEYIVMDGGSTDGSVEILERVSDELAYWQSRPDDGQSWAINRGIERATGDVVAYINSDDYYLPDAFEAALPLFEDPAIRWVAGACDYVNADGTRETLWQPKVPRGPRPRWVREIWYVPQASSFWRRDAFEEFGPLREDLHFIFDAEFGLRLALRGLTPTIVDKTLAVRFLHDEAKSAEGERFMVEYAPVAAEFDRMLPWREHAYDRTLFFLTRVVRALNPLRLQYRLRKKLGLLDLRERWFGGRFAKPPREQQ